MSTLATRFWKFVDRSETGCWEWKGTIHPLGYGKINENGRKRLASRVSYEINVGPIPDGLCVLHKCDNRKCVRPEHLFVGTKGDNNRDARLKDRCARRSHESASRLRANASIPAIRADVGSTNVNAKLTEADVAYARSNPDNMTFRALAEAFGVNVKTMLNAVTGQTWKHVGTPPRIRE